MTAAGSEPPPLCPLDTCILSKPLNFTLAGRGRAGKCGGRRGWRRWLVAPRPLRRPARSPGRCSQPGCGQPAGGRAARTCGDQLLFNRILHPQTRSPTSERGWRARRESAWAGRAGPRPLKSRSAPAIAGGTAGRAGPGQRTASAGMPTRPSSTAHPRRRRPPPDSGGRIRPIGRPPNTSETGAEGMSPPSDGPTG